MIVDESEAKEKLKNRVITSKQSNMGLKVSPIEKPCSNLQDKRNKSMFFEFIQILYIYFSKLFVGFVN